MLSPRYYFINDFTLFEKAIEEKSKSYQKHSKGDILSQLEMCDAYYVKSGVLKWCIVNEDGNIQTVLFAGAGSIMPLQLSTEKFALENVLYLEAMTDVELLVISSKNIQELVFENPSMVASVIYVLDSDISIRKFYPQITQDDLISLTGISRAQTARALKQLRPIVYGAGDNFTYYGLGRKIHVQQDGMSLKESIEKVSK